MYSSVIPGTNVFCNWLFLALSWVSLESAANFRLFHRIAKTLEKRKAQQLLGLNWFSILEMNSWQNKIFLFQERNRFQRQLTEIQRVKYGFNITNFYSISTFVSPIYTSSLGQTWMFLRQVKEQLGKSNLIILFTKEKCRLWWEKHPSIHFSLHRLRFFHLSTEKVRA